MTFRFDTFFDFMLMDGHGGYVWASYLITFVVLVALIVIPFWQKRQLIDQLKRQERISQADQPISSDPA